MISRDKLKKLISKPDALINEDESGRPFSYREFLSVSHKALKEAQKDDGDDIEFIAYENLRNGWIKSHCPPIRYLGEGSGRLAMAVDGGKCLKVAMNDEGVEQNENEIDVLKAGDGFSCFPALYAYDKSKKFSLVVDCCTEMKPSDFIKIYGIECSLAVGTVQQLVDDGMNVERSRKYFKGCIESPELGEEDEWENFDKRLVFLNKLVKLKDSDQMWKSMWDLALFCSSNSMLGMYDLESAVNWGLAGRDGELVPVVIDAGLGNDI